MDESAVSELLGEYNMQPFSFSGIDAVMEKFQTQEFKELPFHLRFRRVSEALTQLITDSPEQAFLLPAIIQFLDRANQVVAFNEPFTLPWFEFWLNHFSGFDDETNRKLRGKIVGKLIPREAYQSFFPIGMGKVFPHTHFVTAHLSPDVDTMIASFWGWIDAFGARVSNGLHIWSLPGGAPETPVTTLFTQLFGKRCFELIARSELTQTLSAIDLVTNSNLSKKQGRINISNLDHGINERAVILVDEKGHYLGDWRSNDVELVRQVVILFKALLRWFETNIHSQLVTLFAKENFHIDDITTMLHECFEISIDRCETVKEFSDAQRERLDLFLKLILKLENGIFSKFNQLIQSLETHGAPALRQFQFELERFPSSGLFDTSGHLEENRPKIFHYIQMLMSKLNESIHQVRNWVERLDISMQIKEKVLGISSEAIQLRTDVEVIRSKMRSYDYMTVTITENSGKQYPVGVVWSKDLRQNVLGTISFRDFCNLDEVKMASYLSVISVVDHHKASLKTNSPPLALLGDVQSCNVIVAEQTMRINDQYSMLGLTADELQEKLQLSVEGSSRLIERLMRRRLAAEYAKNAYVHPSREFSEYLLFIHAILDDTDLLTKVSARDVICTAELLNRMKSLQLQQDVEIITLDDIPEDAHFAKKAAKRILQNEDMYSIYKKTFHFREKEVEESLQLCIEGKPSDLFSDAKVQNRNCRISQTKLFTQNFPDYLKHAKEIQSYWAQTAKESNASHPELDLHIHMMSTIASADEVYKDQSTLFNHQDELWFWIPESELAQNRLASFLTNFQQSPEMTKDELSLEIINPEAEQIFKRNFLPIQTVTKREQNNGAAAPFAILRFNAGTLNSRKAMVSPYLPQSTI